MMTVGSFDAKTHLAKLLERVANGESIEITRRGVPVARLVPISDDRNRNSVEAAHRIREIRKGVTLGDLKLNDLITEGRP